MRHVLAAAFAVTSLLAGSAALACGAAPDPAVPGVAGTAVAEGKNQISIFTASESGYSWDRVQLPSTTRTHVLDVEGRIAGSVETDARVNTAITSQSNAIVELNSAGSPEISTAAEAQTSVFGAALDSHLAWQVVTYQASTSTVALFSETSPGAFTEVSTLHTDCGAPTMLDMAVEADDSLFALCSGEVITVSGRKLGLAKLPTAALALGTSSAGTAVAYGAAANGTDLLRMTHGAQGWVQDGTIPNVGTPVSVLVTDDTSVVVKTASAYTSYTLANGTWAPSSELDALTPVTAATGSPAQILSGQYELTLNSTDGSANAAWTTTDLGALGVAPTLAGDGKYGGDAVGGCSTGVGSSGWAMMAMALFAFVRGGTRSRRMA